MTNKEAIAILENLKTQGETFFSQRFALDLAIKALEGQYKMQYGNCDYCKHKNYNSFEYPCNACSNKTQMWEEADNVKPCSSCAHFNNGNRKSYPCGSCFINSHNMWEAENEGLL